MARVINNLITQGLSGRIGNVIFRTRKGKTFVSAAPDKDKKRVPTENQKAIQVKFQKWAEYARLANTDPALHEFYSKEKKNGQSPYNAAFSDAAIGPVVSDICRLQTSASDSCLIIQATDNFKVHSVHVEIYSIDGKLLECGDAIEYGNRCWMYSLKPQTAKYPKLKVYAAAVDVPGNEGELEVVC